MDECGKGLKRKSVILFAIQRPFQIPFGKLNIFVRGPFLKRYLTSRMISMFKLYM